MKLRIDLHTESARAPFVWSLIISAIAYALPAIVEAAKTILAIWRH